MFRVPRSHLTSLILEFFMLRRVLIASSLIACVSATATAQLVRSGAGPGATQNAFDLFRVDLGGGTVAGANGSFGGVRREINWDGVPAAFSAPNSLTGNFFNSNSPRGAVLSTPGTGFQVSGATTDALAGQPAAANFGNINPTYPGVFSTFSAQRLFTPVGSNITDVTFFLAGTTTAGLTRGFGSIFSDVDLANVSSIEFFDVSNASLGNFFVPNFAGAPSLSFLGVSFATPIVSRVRIIAGNAVLGPGINDGAQTDLVVMDDFVFGEVVAQQVTPEPATFGLLAIGIAVVGVAARRRSSTSL